MNLNYKLRFLVILLVPIIFYLLTKTFNSDYSLPVTIFLTTATFWFLELLPLAVTASLVPVVAILCGILTVPQAMSAFFNDTILLLLAVITLAFAVQKHHCEKRLISKLLNLKLINGSLTSASIAIAACSFFVSMWISNTATAAMFIPISLGLITSLRAEFKNQTEIKVAQVHLLLLCTYSASVGGLATPIGSPPNLFALNFLAKHQIEIGFLQWMLFALPLTLLVMLAGIVILRLIVPLPKIKVIKFEINFDQQKLSRDQKQALITFALALLVWIAPEVINVFWKINFKDYFNVNYLLLIIAASLFLLPYSINGKIKFNLDFSDLKHLEWGTLILFAGGICLGSVLTESGLALALVEKITELKLTPILLLVLVTLLALFLSEFVSNTATLAVLAPIVYGIAQASNQSVVGFFLALTAAASFGFMLPTSTVPNALVFATGKIKLSEMIKVGIAFDMLAWLIAILFSAYYFGIF